jgi:hypothetical protein
MFDINKIKPKVKGQSDKYSWNLYKFLHKQINQKEIGKYVLKQIKVYWLHHSRWDGEYLEFNPNELDIRQIIISPFGGTRTGYFLSQILLEGKNECFALPYEDDELTDITEWFFKTYEKDGRCMFDREHNGWLLGDENRFTYVNNTRKCSWCGKWQHKEIKKVQTIKRKEVWV